jgi:hypothetical protein
MEEVTYRLVRVSADEARELVGTVEDHADIDEVRVRGLASAVRSFVDEVPEFVPNESGYFEVTTEDIEGAVAVLPSLTRFVAYSVSPILSWREDGQVYLRASPESTLLNAVRNEYDAEVATGVHEGVLAEDEGNKKAEKERGE